MLGRRGVEEVVRELNDILQAGADTACDKERLKAIIGDLEPRFLERHIDSALNLDQRA